MSWRRWFGLSMPAGAGQALPAVSVSSHSPDSDFDDGMAAARAGRHAEAAACFERALAAAPEHAAAHRELARARIELGELEAAADALELAVHYQADDAWTCFLQGLLAQRRNDTESALAYYQRALQLDPGFAEAHNNLGYLLLNEYDRLDDAIAHFNMALQRRPDHIDAMLNLGLADLYAGRRKQAIARFDATLKRNPPAADAALARLNRALARLALRQWGAGWDEYEARKEAVTQWTPRPFAFPEWYGETAPGKTLLLYGEQGLGDEIMFASCIPDAMKRAGRCVIECSPKLVSLFERSFAGSEVHAVDPSGNAGWLDGIDLQLGTGSLPRLFRRSAGAFPAHQGYLHADPEKLAAWRLRLQELGTRPKIGLSWRGGTRQTRQARRSLAVGELAAALRGIPADFISLQYGPVEQDLAEFSRQGLEVRHWPEAIADYDQTAALLCGVDLVLSVCTALIHLGGALGRPVWVLAPAFPEWRYGDAGEGMPWYPSVRVLRQANQGDWASLLRRAAGQLESKFRR